MIKYPLGKLAFLIIILYFFAGVYAPLLSAAKPLIVIYDHEVYFPLFRSLFYTGEYSKPIDLFFNLLMFTLPLMLLGFWRRVFFWIGLFSQLSIFLLILFIPLKDPNSSEVLSESRLQKIQESKTLSFEEELQFLTPEAKLDLLLNWKRWERHDQRIRSYLGEKTAYTPFHIQSEILKKDPQALKMHQQWRESSEPHLSFILWPFIREFHWEEDAGGDESMNRSLPWWELTRTNHKDLVAALLFGIRISLTVGLLSTLISLVIAIPIGAVAGFFAGKTDIVVSRLLEIWEGMPTFFMLLLVVAILQSKSIFLIIAVIGFFGWTGFSRYIRGEFFKERNLPYVEAGKVFGFSNKYLMFNHILPNAIAPLITLLPFAILGAISAEAGLAFLGLGEENTPSWGALMDEGRQAFPGQSYLLWPPAILLTTLLISIALVGDALRDKLDPRMS